MTRALLLTLIYAPVFAGDDLPRYKLEPGREIAYHSSFVNKYGKAEASTEDRSRTEWTLWVLRTNPEAARAYWPRA